MQLVNPTLLFVRHAEDADNKADILPGWRNEPLNAKGVAEAQVTAKRLIGFPIAHIYTSPLARSEKTARIIGSVTGAPVTPTNGLLPWNYGEIAGMPNDEKAKRLLTSFQNRPDAPTPNGESFNEYLKRYSAAVAKARDFVTAHPEKALLLSTHSRNLLATKYVLGDKTAPISVDKHSVPNASIWLAEFSDSFPNGFQLTEV